MEKINPQRRNYLWKLVTFKILIIIVVLPLLHISLSDSAGIETCVFLNKRISSRLCFGGNGIDTTSIVFSQCDGPLGNQLNNLASLLAFNMKYGLRPYLLRSQTILLDLLFEKINIPVLEDFENYTLKTHLKIHKIGEMDTSGDHYYDEFMENPEPLLKGHTLDIGKCPNALFFYKSYLSKIKEKLVIKRKYLLEANEILSNISRMYEGKNVIFIGIHVHKMDYESHLYSSFEAKASYVNKTFFDKAMEEFRMRLQNQGEVIFVIVSDDITWIEDNLGSHKNVYIGSKRQKEKCTRMARDFALLTLCNHTILTDCPFGQWGALLAGGHTILPRRYTKKIPKELKAINRAKLANWSFILF